MHYELRASSHELQVTPQCEGEKKRKYNARRELDTEKATATGMKELEDVHLAVYSRRTHQSLSIFSACA